MVVWVCVANYKVKDEWCNHIVGVFSSIEGVMEYCTRYRIKKDDWVDVFTSNKVYQVVVSETQYFSATVHEVKISN